MEQRPHQQPAKVCIIHIAVAMGMLGWPEPREMAKTIAYGHLVEFFFFWSNKGAHFCHTVLN